MQAEQLRDNWRDQQHHRQVRGKQNPPTCFSFAEE
jgi:hypothetical protein